MNISGKVGKVADPGRFLIKELAEHRGISIGIVRRMITALHAKGYVQVLKPKRSFIGEPVSHKDQREVYRRISDRLLKINFRMPVPASAEPDRLFGGNPDYIEERTELLQLVITVEI